MEKIKKGENEIIISGLNYSAKCLLLACLKKELEEKIVFVQPISQNFSNIEETLIFFFSQFNLDTNQIAILPPFSSEPYDEIPPSLDSISQRMKFFYKFKNNKAEIVITNLMGLLKPLPCKSVLENSFIFLSAGSSIKREYLIETLSQFGYKAQDLVNFPGEYAFRGAIVDVFSPWEDYPFRIELSGNEILSIRKFSPTTQRSIQTINTIIIPSLLEFPLNEEFILSWEKNAELKWKSYKFHIQVKEMKDSLYKRDPLPSLFYLASIAHPFFASFKEYFSDYLFIFDEPEQTEEEWEKKKEKLEIMYKNIYEKKKISLSPSEIFCKEDLKNLRNQKINFQSVPINQDIEIISFNFQDSPHFRDNLNLFIREIDKLQKKNESIAIFLSNWNRIKKMADLLDSYQISYLISEDSEISLQEKNILLLLGKLPFGFCFPEEKVTIFSENDIIKEEEFVSLKPSFHLPFSYFRDLKEGDYIVHNDHGIGIFKGLKELKIDGVSRELIEIMYKDGDRLYVPVERLDLIQKYSGVEGVPIIDKLGGTSWQRTKKRVKNAIRKMAKELLELYAKRKSIKGYSFSPDTPWQKEFEETFPYEETEDQLKVTEEIKKDMEAPCPMDRLLCGDVGFGKTEVAIRAAVKAVWDGKQVAVLCPTTVLATQHLNTFRKRLSMFPFRVEALTRLQSSKNQKKIISDLEKGLVDIIIGTHRLLSDDVKFKNLGLLIIDEEQRFGVTHKEKIKKMKTQIDVLTMTATPIPRTLNMALYGLRDLSLIETPPKDRLAVHTVVAKFSPELIASAIEKELSRGGQIYFVHNRINDLESIVKMVSRLVPKAKIVVIHGKMPSHKIEKNMLDFIQGKYNVLISTTIIENGIDIPLVNTIIVNEAHQFGLAQLYQLRGRVGRSYRQAYAYFLIPSEFSLNPIARERLRALQEFTELGSGFRLAYRDLEIRGAGNLFGLEQHGHLKAVGFDYYLKLLDQTIKELKGEAEEKTSAEINLKINIKIPEDYLPQMNQRLNFYQKISSISSLGEIEKIKEEMEDRFGPLPQSCLNLLDYGVIKFLAERIKIVNIDREGEILKIKFSRNPKTLPEKIVDIMKYYKGNLTKDGILKIKLNSQEDRKILEEVKYILHKLT
ncbi:transcription-repair coupling factor [Candidatus Aminicenantes bacterium AH-873-B07]|nr:transcription-repair coupling factor [Candidatus Aminicenantes bacterium AH-873-B07]